jgi:chloramphenicol-sensitive protein RarD
MWGLFPLYLIGLRAVSAMQITAHRIVWSCVFVLAWLALRGELGQLRSAVRRDGVLIRLVASAFFIAVNWVGFAWAVNHDHVLEVSLAYFMGPLLNVLLGIFVLSERLDRTQWISVGFAAAGVAYLTFIAGHTPWIALMVGSSFALYGLIRKTVRIDALPGLAVETILLAPFAVGYLVWCEIQGIGMPWAFERAGGWPAAHRRSRHFDSAVPLRVRCAPRSVLDDRRAPVHCAESATAVRPRRLR